MSVTVSSSAVGFAGQLAYVDRKLNEMSAPASSDVFGFVRDLSLARDVATVAGVLRQRARALVGSDGLTFILREGAFCHYVEEDAIGPLWKGRRFPMESCVSGWVMQHGVAAVIPDIFKDPRVPHEWYKQTFVRSMTMVPVGDPAMAAIGAYWAVERETPEQHVILLQVLADAAAMAMKNAQLYGDLHRALAEARASNQAKDRLLAMVGHELRNPLGAMTTALGLMRLRPDRERGEHARGVIERQVRHMSRLVDELLDLERLSHGAILLVPERVQVQTIIHQAIEVSEPVIRAGSHSLIVNTRDADAWLNVDPLRVQQVIANLLINAARYTPEHGRIGLSSRVEHGRFVVSVTDNGIGLTPDIAPRVFEPFVRGEVQGNVSGGVGVGLALVKQIVLLHGGTVDVHSDGPDTGCEFTVSIPVGFPAAVSQVAHSSLD